MDRFDWLLVLGASVLGLGIFWALLWIYWLGYRYFSHRDKETP